MEVPGKTFETLAIILEGQRTAPCLPVFAARHIQAGAFDFVQHDRSSSGHQGFAATARFLDFAGLIQ